MVKTIKSTNISVMEEKDFYALRLSEESLFVFCFA